MSCKSYVITGYSYFLLFLLMYKFMDSFNREKLLIKAFFIFIYFMLNNLLRTPQNSN